MDIDKLENFLTFTRYMNFTMAANEAFMDTSVFHRQISSIENELGIQLIQRENRAMSLTPAGESFAKGIQSVLDLYHIEVQKAIDLNSGIRGSILICNIFGHALSDTLSMLINRFEASYPDIKISVISKSMAESRSMLQKGYIDFAVARDEVYSLIENKESLEIEEIHAGVAIHADLLPAGACNNAENTFNLAVLDHIPLIWCKDLMSERGSKILQEREQKMGPDSVIWVDDLEATYSYLELKRGFTLINDLNYFRTSPVIRYIPNMENVIHHSIVWKKNNVNACAKVFIEFLKNHLGERNV